MRAWPSILGAVLLTVLAGRSFEERIAAGPLSERE